MVLPEIRLTVILVNVFSPLSRELFWRFLRVQYDKNAEDDEKNERREYMGRDTIKDFLFVSVAWGNQFKDAIISPKHAKDRRKPARMPI